MSMRVGYQGVPGAYSEAALLQLQDQQDWKDLVILNFPSFESVFKAVVDKTLDRAFLPIQNSLGGSIHENYDLLLRYRLYIVAEFDFKVRHCLLALPGTKITDIKKVISHPQALAQCDEYIRSLNIEKEAFSDTSGAAKEVSEKKLEGIGAIASERAASLYGLEILAKDIQDDSNNFTRFLLMATSFIKPPRGIGNPVTSIVFALQNDIPGALFKAFSVFALRDINLTKIESRPAKFLSKYFDVSDLKSKEVDPSSDASSTPSYRYAFYADLAVHIDDLRAENALKHLAEIAPVIRTLGVYLSMKGKEDSSVIPIPWAALPKIDSHLNIVIFGFGNFAQFLSKTFIKQGHNVYGTSRTDYSIECARMGVHFFPTVEELVEKSPKADVVILSMSILSFESFANRIPWDHPILRDSLVVDVLSVKLLPKEVLQKILPTSCDIICTHPMFGPESGKHGWRNLPFVYEKIRIKDNRRCEDFLKIWSVEGCRMVPLSCESHDAYAAGSQFITHLTGRVLGQLGPSSTPINTKGFETLLDLVSNTSKDSFDLFYALFKNNPNSFHQLEAFEAAFHRVKTRLLTRYEGAPTDGAGLLAGLDLDPLRLSKIASSVEISGTAAINDRALELKRQGVNVASLCVGEPDFPVPPAVADAIIAGVKEGDTKYTPVAGTFALRKAIAQKLKAENGLTYEPSQIVISNGAKQSLAQAVMALCGAGDQVLIPAPYWVSYKEMATMAGADSVIIPCGKEVLYKLSPEALEATLKSSPRARLLILCYPCNPSGAVYSKKELEEIAAVLRKYPGIAILSDEIYEYIMYDDSHTSFASLEGMYGRTVTVNGFSKGFCMTGLRVGYIAAPLPVVNACTILQSNFTSGSCSISQRAALAAIGLGKSASVEMVKSFRGRRDYIISRLAAIPKVECPVPQGAFYVLPDISQVLAESEEKATDMDFCMRLLNEFHAAAVPGSSFGCPGTVRISYSAGMEVLSKAMDAFESCVKSYLKK